MKKIFCLFLCTAFMCVANLANAASGISSFRIGQGVGNVRLVFDADKKFDYKVFLLDNPNRLVIDAQNITISPNIEKGIGVNSFISNARLSTDGKRVVFDLLKPVTIKKAFMLPPQSTFSWRLVIDLEPATERDFASKIGENKPKSNSVEPYRPIAKAQTSNAKKIIVLDPGHGGRDPGAIGYSGIYEKHITLSFAKELKENLEKNGKYKVYLTRTGDYSVALRDRVKFARKNNADLFLSIHADSMKNKSTKGLSVYTLSENASDREAAALAERENKADIVAGLNFAEHTKEVADILLNLAQRETLNRSSEFATFMVGEMRKTVKLLDNTHRFAGFAVLKAPDVPSVLLEMGYLSNRTEEKLLKQKDYRKKLADSANMAIDKFFENMQHASVF